MEGLIISEKPQLRNPCLIAGFYGWPNAAAVSSTALGYLIGKLEAKKLAEINSEEFYVFTQNRPQTRIEGGLVKQFGFPRNEFYFSQGKKDLILLLGQEPDLKWKKYIKTVLDFISQWEVKRVYTVGGEYASVPHTREPKISVVVNEEKLGKKIEISGINYEGPTSIQTHFSPACKERGIECLSLWGDAPEYLRTPNLRVTYSILEKLEELEKIDLDLEDIQKLAQDFDDKVKKQINEVLRQKPEFQIYLKKLEEEYDRGRRVTEPTSEELIKYVEDFLKQQRKKP